MTRLSCVIKCIVAGGILIVAAAGLCDGFAAQANEDPGAIRETFQERMQRSVSKQAESALRMQSSVERQRQAVRRQAGQTAVDQASGPPSFFALPGPSHLAPPHLQTGPREAESAKEATPAFKSSEPAVSGSETDDEIPPPGLIPFDPNLLIPRPVEPVGNIQQLGAAGTAHAPLGLTGLEGLVNTTAKRGDGSESKLDELLRGLGAQGGALLPGNLRPQPDAGAPYSGLESAPLTSFSLVNWLFGL